MAFGCRYGIFMTFIIGIFRFMFKGISQFISTCSFSSEIIDCAFSILLYEGKLSFFLKSAGGSYDISISKYFEIADFGYSFYIISILAEIKVFIKAPYLLMELPSCNYSITACPMGFD